MCFSLCACGCACIRPKYVGVCSRYWCGFGPQEEMDGCSADGLQSASSSILAEPSPEPHSSSSLLKGDRKRSLSNTAGQFKRGCQCHFTVNRLYEAQDIAMISYVHPYHTNKQDLVCHGEDMKEAANAHMSFSPWISIDKKMWVFSLLQRGFTPTQVMERHIHDLHTMQEKDLSRTMTRDDFLSLKDIINISSKLASHTYQLHDLDAESTRRWCIQNSGITFAYQEQDSMADTPFVLGIQTPWQKDMCRQYGHDNVLAMDSTFGTNKYKVYTLPMLSSLI